MRYLKEDLKKLLLTKKELDQYGGILNESPTGFAKDLVLEFITYVYHPQSPFMEIKNIVKRKFEVATYVRFPTNKDGTLRGSYESIILGTNREVNARIIHYLRLTKSPDYELLQVLTESYYNTLEALKNVDNTKTDDSKEQKERAMAREKLLKVLSDTRNEMIEIEARLLSGDDGKKLLQELYQGVDDDINEIRPEDIAQRIMDGDDPLRGLDPYK